LSTSPPPAPPAPPVHPINAANPATAAHPTAAQALPCPCGRALALTDCCLPLAHKLRQGTGVRPSPFDEIRASSALLLWGLLSTERHTTPITQSLSRQAHRFWGAILTAALAPASPERITECVPIAGNDATANYGTRMFERTWGSTDAETRTWLWSTLPAFARAEPLLGEMALDWLLWDQPWLRRRPAAHWTAHRESLSRRPRVQRTYQAILRSQLGLWRLEEAVPHHGFRLLDRLTGDRTLLHTDSDPWPEANERLLLARVYSFGRWRLLAGRCLLLDPIAVQRLLAAIEARAAATSAPSPHDPHWRAWLKAELIPLAAGQWLATRLAPPPPARYHGTHC